MNIKMLRNLAISSLFLSMLMLPAAVHAQVLPCSGIINGPDTFDDVIVAGGLCTLNSTPGNIITVRGSVLVSGTGRLKTTGTGVTLIRGSIQVNSGNTVTPGTVVVDLANVTVLGDVIVKDSEDNVIVGLGATIGALNVEKSGMVTASGTLESIESKESGGISLNGATVFPGGVSVELATDSLVICGSTIEGQVKVAQTEGDVHVGVSCGASTISTIGGSVSVEKGTGDVLLVGATKLTAGDLIVIEQTGNVELKGSNGCDPLSDPSDPLCAIVGDVKVEKIAGNITLTDVIADSDITMGNNGGEMAGGDITLTNVTAGSDTSIVDNGAVNEDGVKISGDVTIESSTIGGDVAIILNKMVTLTNNSFALEDVLISGNIGPVVVDGNCDMRLTVTENTTNVTIRNNNPTDATAAGATCEFGSVTGFGFTDADVSKNSGGVTITNNTGEGLFCSDNVPAPIPPLPSSGLENTITFRDGQCAGF